MKNVNYNLIKTLHGTLDDVWRLEKYYINDAEKERCESQGVLKTMLQQRKKDAESLIAAIKMRMDAGTFN
jgi:hypothetical protein